MKRVAAGQVNLYRALEPEWSRTRNKVVFYLQFVTTAWSVPVFFMALLVYSLLMNMLRLQADRLCEALKVGEDAQLCTICS